MQIKTDNVCFYELHIFASVAFWGRKTVLLGTPKALEWFQESPDKCRGSSRRCLLVHSSFLSEPHLEKPKSRRGTTPSGHKAKSCIDRLVLPPEPLL